MEKHLVSVCTPVYNGERFLEDCIKGVLNQTYSNIEYIIVDNASADNTPAIIEKYKSFDGRIKTYRNDSTLNVIDNFNACAKRISKEAKWIKYALADDYLFPNCIEEMVGVGERDPDIGLVSAYRLYGGQATNLGLPIEKNVFPGHDILKMQLLRRLHVCSSSPNSLIYKRDVFNKLDGFNNKYLHADTELAFRIIDKYKLGFVHYFLSKTGLHSGRGEVYSLRRGIVIREYLDFGFSKLTQYASIRLTPEEMDELCEYYAHQILAFIAANIPYFRFHDIHEMLGNTPRSIKRKFPRSVWGNWRTYLRKFVSSIYHYPDYLRNVPTFKHIK